MLLSGIILCILGIVAYLFVADAQQGYQIALCILFVLFAQTWMTFLGAMQSWMVHEVAERKDATVLSGFKRALHNWKDIIAYAVVFLIISIILGALRKRGRAGELAAGFFGALAGIAGKLILPAMIITNKTFGEAVNQLKHSIKAVPEIATYEIGIRPIAFLAVLLGALLTYLLAQLSGTLAFIFIIAYIIFLILASVFINNTFYTLLYISLIEKKNVPGLNLR